MKRILLITAALLVFGVGLVFAQMRMGGGACDSPGQMGMGSGGHGGHRGMGQCNILECKDLNLTEDQQAKIKELQYQHQNRMIELRADMQKARLEERHAMQADNPSKATVLAATKEVSRIRGLIAEEKVNQRFAIFDVLTADQAKIWKSCHGPGQGMMKGFRGDPGCGNGPGMEMKQGPGGCKMGFNPKDEG